MIMYVVCPLTSLAAILLVLFTSGTVFAQQEGDLRLTGFGASQVSGRLELFLNNQWSTICINGFTKKDADTACRQFGGDKAVEYGDTNKLGFGQAIGPVNIIQLNCSSSDIWIIQCAINAVSRWCNHSSDVAVVCRSNRIKRQNDPEGRCTDSGCRTGSSDPPDTNWVVFGIVMGVGLIAAIVVTVTCVCLGCGWCSTTIEVCQALLARCINGCVGCVKLFDLRRYCRQKDTNTRNPTSSTDSPPTVTVILEPQPRNDATGMSVRCTQDTSVEQPTHCTVTFSATQPNNSSEQQSSDSINSYTVHVKDDNIPPDYTHALQYCSTEKNETKPSPVNLSQPPPPSYDSVN
ncbi:uncharacterized protein [Dysidea avara]|uniref:uncharacterized protein isoform X2 n=1 Tax=Dysidea avara TaxID=196820 RepID=UPI0033328C7F